MRWVTTPFSCICEGTTTVKIKKPSSLIFSSIHVKCEKCESTYLVRYKRDSSGPNKVTIQRQLLDPSELLKAICLEKDKKRKNLDKNPELYRG